MKSILSSYIAVFCLLLALPGSVLCADLEVRAEADKAEVASGDILNFSLTIAGLLEGSPRVEIGTFDGFSILATRQRQQIQVEQGKQVRSILLVYALVAGDPGDRTLGPVKVMYEGQLYETKPVQVKVVPGVPGSRVPSSKPEPNKPRLQGGVVL